MGTQIIHVGYDITDTLYPCILDETDRSVWFRTDSFVNFCKDYNINIQIDKTNHISVVNCEGAREIVLKRNGSGGGNMFNVPGWDFSMFIFQAKMIAINPN